MKKREEIAKEMRRVTANLDERWLRAASKEVCANIKTLLASLPAERDHLVAWLPRFAGEVDLTALIREELNKRVIFLPYELDESSLGFIRVDGMERDENDSLLRPQPFNVALAPRTVLLVPGLAFDVLGGRVGRGQSYYDTLLRQPAMDEALRIGVCLSLQLVSRVPSHEHPVAVDWIVHERGTIEVAKDLILDPSARTADLRHAV